MLIRNARQRLQLLLQIVCADLTVCDAATQYETEAPTATLDHVCAGLTLCDAATQYETSGNGAVLAKASLSPAQPAAQLADHFVVTGGRLGSDSQVLGSFLCVQYWTH